MHRHWVRAGFTVLCLGVFAVPALADNRVALVIGNGAYAHVPHLPNPSHDAQDVAAALRRTGFQTIVGIDLDQAGMQDAAIRFARAARTADVAMFYYSGHALQFAGVNYMVPIDAQLHDEADLRRMSRVDEVVADLQQARNLRILVLDSCRDNPLADELKRSIGISRSTSIGRGLARIDSPEGMIVAYATQAGRTAEDGGGRNSPYTAAFLRNVEAKEEIGTIFRRISADVYQATRQTQLPELSLSLIGEFYLNGKLQITVAPPLAPADPCAVAGDHWKSAEAINTRGAFEDHLARFPSCAFAGLARARIEVLSVVAPNPVPAAAPPAPSETAWSNPAPNAAPPNSPVAPQKEARPTDTKSSLKLTATGRPILDFGQGNPVSPATPGTQPTAAVEAPIVARPSGGFTATGRPILVFGKDPTPPTNSDAPQREPRPSYARRPSAKLTATGRPILEFKQE
jgi:hypothetical protein